MQPGDVGTHHRAVAAGYGGAAHRRESEGASLVDLVMQADRAWRQVADER